MQLDLIMIIWYFDWMAGGRIIREVCFRMLMSAFETNACIYWFFTPKSILLKLSRCSRRRGGLFFFLNKVVRARTGECEPCVIINIESLAIVCYASSLFFFLFLVTHTFNVTFHRCSISYKTRAKAENGWREKKTWRRRIWETD